MNRDFNYLKYIDFIQSELWRKFTNIKDENDMVIKRKKYLKFIKKLKFDIRFEEYWHGVNIGPYDRDPSIWINEINSVAEMLLPIDNFEIISNEYNLYINE